MIPQADAACNTTDNRLVGRNKYVINTMSAPPASAWLPILLRYQPVDRRRPFRQAALTSSASAYIALLLMLLTP